MIPLFKVTMSDNAPKNVEEVLKSGMVGEGPKVAEFKKKLEARFKCKNLIPLNSCTSALTLALRLCEVEGYEVITTPFTMVATNFAILATGGIPVFADLEENGVNISVDDIKRKITSRTKAILVTHVGGIPCEMTKLKKLGVPIISDAAHAIDTYYHGEHISHWADYTCFSFQSIKQLTTGDGGALVIKNDKDYLVAERLKWFGISRVVPEGMTRLEHQMTADIPVWGYKFHMNDISASIGLANLPKLGWITSRQRKNADYYKKHLKDYLPNLPKNCQPSWWAFPILVKDRDKFIKKMTEKGIEVTPMWRRNDEYSVFKDWHEYAGVKPTLSNMDKLSKKIVFIPVGWWVNPKKVVEAICE